jgi:hypothetical protein
METNTKTDNRKRRLSVLVRKKTRRSLRDLFASFLRDATEEEIWFLHDVMVTWESTSTRSETEIQIASAFDSCLDCRGDYLLLKSVKMKPEVEKFIRDLTENSGAFQPRGDGWYLWKNRRKGAA